MNRISDFFTISPKTRRRLSVFRRTRPESLAVEAGPTPRSVSASTEVNEHDLAAAANLRRRATLPSYESPALVPSPSRRRHDHGQDHHDEQQFNREHEPASTSTLATAHATSLTDPSPTLVNQSVLSNYHLHHDQPQRDGGGVGHADDQATVVHRPTSPVGSLLSQSSSSSRLRRRHTISRLRISSWFGRSDPLTSPSPSMSEEPGSSEARKINRRQRHFRRAFTELDPLTIQSMFTSFKCTLDLDVFWKGILFVTPQGLFFYGCRLNPFVQYNPALYNTNLPEKNPHSQQQSPSLPPRQQPANGLGRSGSGTGGDYLGGTTTTDPSLAPASSSSHHSGGGGHSSLPFPFALPTKYPDSVRICLPFETIRDFHKESLLGILPNVIRIRTATRHYIFTGFLSRDSTHQSLQAAQMQYQATANAALNVGTMAVALQHKPSVKTSAPASPTATAVASPTTPAAAERKSSRRTSSRRHTSSAAPGERSGSTRRSRPKSASTATYRDSHHSQRASVVSIQG
ncbi:hypothetical protein BJ085DRAFT_28858 [Dimargaris cristalligena]|uniref:GRAM domain-containing protein n=1 Tax=Dimargaris cristalligena TaxID=215637 RepID=A0A4P9ZX26_9FUNG|nr:hypothetical protein BJ085DRAFT_28858 [Dimargaris cristalligena]|eukprot:RKP37908.1 hypothetical protein BJ085DRAFT_28858 [Dimargaris cristalligena]